jgi:hypothetical protein
MQYIWLPDTSKPINRWTRHERTQFWVHLIPYMLFPSSENELKRNAVQMVLLAKFLWSLEHLIKNKSKGNKSGKGKEIIKHIHSSEKKFFRKHNGLNAVAEAESFGQLVIQEKKTIIKSISTCLCIFQFLWRMNEYGQEIPDCPSINKAKRLVELENTEGKLWHDNLTTLYTNPTSISNAWSNYKPSIHLIAAYGLCRAYARKNSSETCRMDALDDIETFLGLALHFQDVALSLSTGRQEKPVITPDEIWWLSNPFGVEKIEIPAEPLTDDQLARLRGYTA